MGKLDGKVVVITGGGSGVGYGIAKALAVEGASLVITSRDIPKLRLAATNLEVSGGTVLAVKTDVTCEAEVQSLFKYTVDELGSLDVLVNGADVTDYGALEDLSIERWQKVLDVNITGVFLCCREAMSIMKKQRYGRILNIGSVSAQMPRVNTAAYSTTKHALSGMTKALALEGRDFGVVASCIHPGNVLGDSELKSRLQQAHDEPAMTIEDLAVAVLAMVALPPDVNILESTIFPSRMPYLGRG